MKKFKFKKETWKVLIENELGTEVDCHFYEGSIVHNFLKDHNLMDWVEEVIENKWVRSQGTGNIIFNKGYYVPSFGFYGRTGDFTDILTIPQNTYKEVELEEVEKLFTKEADRRGYGKGVVVKCLSGGGIEELSEGTIKIYTDDPHNVYYKGAIIFSDGKWASVVTTKEDSLKAEIEILKSKVTHLEEKNKNLVKLIKRQDKKLGKIREALSIY